MRKLAKTFIWTVLSTLSLALPLASAAALAEDADRAAVTITALDGKTWSGALQSIADGKLILVKDGKPHTLEAGDLLRLEFSGRKTKSPAGPLVLLANGDRLAVVPTGIEGEEIVGEWTAFPERPAIRIPLVTIAGIALHLPETRSAGERAVRTIQAENGDADVIVLRNGDRVTGQFQKLTPSSVILKGPAGEVTVERENIQTLGFNPRFVSFPKAAGPRVLVVMTDGSRVTGRNVALDGGGRLRVEALFGPKLEIPVEAVGTIQFFGGRAAYLSDLEPADYSFTPYLSGHWDLRRDTNVEGGPLRLRGREFAKGLGMHSRSRVTYDLDGDDRLFRATAGIDDSAQGGGSAVFAVEVDGERVFASTPQTGKSPPLEIGPVDIAGKRRLTLIVEFGPLGDILDRADWCDAVLVTR